MTGALPAILVLLAAEPIERTTRTGPVEAVVALSPAEPVIGDTVTLTLRVTAEKDVELLMPEFGQMMDRYTILDYTTTERVDDQSRTVAEQVYELQPARSGKQSIAPIMVEFVDRRAGSKPAPDDMDAYELLTERIAFAVKSVLPTDAKAELNPPLEALDPLPVVQVNNYWWILPVVAAVIALPLVIWWAMVSRRKARRRSAYEIAAERLRRLLGWSRTGPEQMDAFFVELSAIVRRYVEDRFELRAPELTTEEFMASMSRSPDLTRDHQSLLRDFLRRADLVKFAHFTPSEADIDDSVGSAKRFLDETRHIPVEAAHA